jgi:hypothetical protein
MALLQSLVSLASDSLACHPPGTPTLGEEYAGLVQTNIHTLLPPSFLVISFFIFC